MAQVGDKRRAVHLLFRRVDVALEDALAERPLRYPSGTAFVAADAEGYEEAVAMYLEEGRRVVAVFPDDTEKLFTPGAASARGLDG